MVGVLGLVFVVFIALAILNPLVIIGAGQRGVVFNRGSGIENRILGEGMHFRIPMVESVTTIPVRTQATDFEEKGTDSAGTKDSQQVDVKVTVNWHLNPDKVNNVYQKVGDLDAIKTVILQPAVRDGVKSAISQFAALEVQKSRDIVAANAESVIQAKIQKYDVILDNFSITNINFSEQFNAAVENAQKANQDAVAAENHVKEVEANAEAAIAQAKGEAEAQKQVQETLTPELLEKLYLERWNGQLPTYFGSGVLPFFNLK